MNRIVAFLFAIFAINIAHAEDRFFTLSSTTSTQDFGLFGYVLPIFKSGTGIDVHVVAVGTGQALVIGQRGDADALLVHDRVGEDKFVTHGFGIDRRDVMYNDFVIVGPNLIQRISVASRMPRERCRKSPTLRRHSRAAGTTAAPIAWSSGYGSPPVSSPIPIPVGIAISAKAWARRSTSLPA